MFRGMGEGTWDENESEVINRVLKKAGMDEGLLRAKRRKKRIQGHSGKGRFVIADCDATKLAKVWTKGKEILKKVGVGLRSGCPGRIGRPTNRGCRTQPTLKVGTP